MAELATDHYEVLDKLGGGGMGVVYKARDRRLHRLVALKFLPPHLGADEAAKERFVQEARAASQLDHPNICTIYDIGETEDGRLFIAMACYEGETLKKRIAREPLSVEKAVAIAVQIAQGLDRAHEKEIVHRDVKPANVMVTTRGDVKVLDFGLAKLAGTADLTKTGSTVGTAAYMSPEQVRGEAVDARTDVWSLGVVLYEMLAGVRPFQGEYEHAVLYSILNTSPEPLAHLSNDIPDELEHVVRTCLETDPAKRYPSMEALLADLRRIQDGSDEPTHRNSSYQPQSRPSSRFFGRKHMVALISAGVTLLLLLGWLTRDQLPDARHLAVLPFSVIGNMTDAQAFSDGFTETLTSKLTQLEQFQGSLWVVPASEVRTSMTPTDARERFGVTLVVTGSLQIEAERARLTLNLIDAKTRRQLDSKQFDHRIAGQLALQDEAVLMLARMLHVELRPQEQEVLTAGGTTRPRANEFYLRGLGYLRSHQSVEDLDGAIRLFDTAIDNDSLFALAYAGLGEAYWQKYRLTDDVRWVDDAVRYSQRALALNDALAPVYVTLGLIYTGKGEYEEALQVLRQALEIDPFNAEAYRRRASVYRRQGRFDEAEAAYRQAIALKPDYWRGYNSLGVYYYTRGQYEDAITQFNHGLQLAPANQNLLTNVGAAYWQLQRLDEAIQTFERVLQVDPDNANATSNLATAYFYQGRFGDAARLYEKELKLHPHDYAVQGFLADAYYWNPGRRPQARQAYRKAISMAREHLEVRPDDPEMLGTLASYYAKLGVRDTAGVLLERAVSGVQPEHADVVTAFGIGETYEHLGRREEALVWMESSLAQGYGWIQVTYSPWLKAFREDPAVQERLARYR